MSVRVACAQLNQIIGDFEGNLGRIVASAQRAHEEGARILLTSELALSAYPPEDLLLRPGFYDSTQEALSALCRASERWPDLRLVVGHPWQDQGVRFNAASLIHSGRHVALYYKHELPNYGVFDERRYFESGHEPLVFAVDGVRFGVAICEDFWFDRVPAAARSAGAQILLGLNASPFHGDKHARRLDVLRRTVCAQGMAVIVTNQVGAHDELIFDGLSCALNADGSVAAQAPAFESVNWNVDVGPDVRLFGACVAVPEVRAQLYGALVLGVRDYLDKNRFPGAIIGLSGGIDSALTLAIAVDALGADRVRAVMLPSRFTAPISLEDASDMAQRLGVRYDVMPIEPCFEAFLATLAAQWTAPDWDTTEENLQARIRGTLLMALSNKTGWLVLTTGNKSETAVGYSTLYGDLAGGLAVIKDVLKTQVYALAAWRNQSRPVIPERIMTRPPSAKLRPNQTDQDTLPPYEQLDAIVQRYMEDNQSVAEIVADGYAPEAGLKVVRLIRLSEYKRRQSPLGLRVTERAFGRDWRYPITARFQD